MTLVAIQHGDRPAGIDSRITQESLFEASNGRPKEKLYTNVCPALAVIHNSADYIADSLDGAKTYV